MTNLYNLLNAGTFEEAEFALDEIISDENCIEALIEGYKNAKTVEALWGILKGLMRSGNPQVIKIFDDVMESYPERHVLFQLANEAKLSYLSKEKRIKRRLKDLKSNDWIIVMSALEHLGAEGDNTIISSIETVASKWHKKEIQEQVQVTILNIREGVQGLVNEYYDDKLIYSKDAILRALSQKPYKEAIQINVELIYSQDHKYHAGALTAVNEKYPRAIIPRLEEILLTDSLIMCRSEAIGSLVKIAKSKDPEILRFLEDFIQKGKWKTKLKPWKWIEEITLKDEAMSAINIIKKKR